MSLYQRGTTWYVKVSAPNGTQIRRSTGTADKKRAEEYHDKLKTQLWEQTRLGVKPKRTWDEAALKWLEETAHKRSTGNDKRHIAFFTEHLRGRTLNQIDRELVQMLVEKRLSAKSNASRNRHVATLRAIMRRAQREWGWIDTVPAFRMYPEPKGRTRWLTPEEIQRLLMALPAHTKPIVVFSLATGLRLANAVRAKWGWVNGRTLTIPGEHFKNGETHSVPLNDTAWAILEAERGKHAEAIFTYRGRPVLRVNQHAFRRAVERAKLADFRWHDLRHTWASHMRQAGVSLTDLQELAGWKTHAMAQRYAHVNVSHLAPVAARVDAILSGVLSAGHTSGHTPAEAGQ